MAERWQYAVMDLDDQLWELPERMATLLADLGQGWTAWKRRVQVDDGGVVVAAGDWHPVGGGGDHGSSPGV